ncbi:hypothetical protein C8J57DRAFT_263377 [Mycena rebaudengoi]|nr:hypothetical protein C8J57DRAFT_263377 [Mycena rebaudengoi]
MLPSADVLSTSSFNAHGTLGALQVGVMISYVLFGVSTTQTYIFYTRFAQDSLKLKLLVAFVWFCELGHVICVGHSLYAMTITDYGHPERLLLVPQSLVAAFIFSGLIGSSVQSFFALRIYRLSKSPYIPCLCWALSFLRLLGSLIGAVFAFSMQSVASYQAHFRWLLATVWIASVVSDLTIALTLVYFLYRARDNVQERTVALLDKLIAWNIETGLLTLAINVVILACFLTMRESYIWLSGFIVGARLFSNSLLASLNSRESLRAMDEAGTIPYSSNRTPLHFISKTTQTAFQEDP